MRIVVARLTGFQTSRAIQNTSMLQAFHLHAIYLSDIQEQDHATLYLTYSPALTGSTT